MERRDLKGIPEVDHGVDQEQQRGEQGQRGEAEWKGEEVNVEHAEVEEEHSWEEADGDWGSDAVVSGCIVLCREQSHQRGNAIEKSAGA